MQKVTKQANINYVEELANELSIEQQEFIWKSIKDIGKNENEHLNNLCNLQVKTIYFEKYESRKCDMIIRDSLSKETIEYLIHGVIHTTQQYIEGMDTRTARTIKKVKISQ